MKHKQKIPVDHIEEEALDTIADYLNISRQAVIKMFLRQALDQHYLANQKKESA
jgi:hypothetical protein